MAVFAACWVTRGVWVGCRSAVSDWLAWMVALTVGSARPALTVALAAGCRLEVCNPAGSGANMPDGGNPVGWDDMEADSLADDSANCRHIREEHGKVLVADGTIRSADDKDFPIRPRLHGCNRPGVIPSSIPTRPIPKAGCWPLTPRLQSPYQN
jgi:hypothetical protein